MAGERTRLKRGGRHTVIAALAAVLLASCSTSGDDVPFGLSTVSVTPAEQTEADFAAETTNTLPSDAQAPTPELAFVTDANDPELPAAVASAPTLRPDAVPDLATAVLHVPAPQGEAQMPAEPAVAQVPVPTPTQAEPAQTAPTQVATATPEPQPTAFLENSHAVQQAATEPPKKRGFLSSFFATPARAATAPQAPRTLIAPAESPKPLVASAGAGRQADTDPAPLVRLASTTPGAAGASALPGVRQNGLFEITRRSGLDDDSDIDVHEGDEEYQVASAAGLARLAPNGLMKQTDNVDVACLKPSLVRTLKTIENHYGKKVVVTSGYRNSERNRKARGARNSLHMYCAAADIQVAGVDKWQLAEFLRTMPGRGGVGTYCHTNSVHIDVGPERDWNWRCRRRK